MISVIHFRIVVGVNILQLLTFEIKNKTYQYHGKKGKQGRVCSTGRNPEAISRYVARFLICPYILINREYPRIMLYINLYFCTSFTSQQTVLTIVDPIKTDIDWSNTEFLASLTFTHHVLTQKQFTKWKVRLIN